MRFNLCGNNNNGWGLQKDFEVLKARLEGLGHTTHTVQYGRDEEKDVPEADVNIHIELVVNAALRRAPQQWAMPNPEWWLSAWDRARSLFTKFICKTPDCYRIFNVMAPGKCELMPFVSSDMREAGHEMKREFLHIAGNSQTKNTEAVIAAWRGMLGGSTRLTLVTNQKLYQQDGLLAHNVVVYGRISEEEKRVLLNTHLFHLCPSRYEGWGHYIHESMSVGAVIVTTNAEPMRSIAGLQKDLMVPPYRVRDHGAGKFNLVRGPELMEVVRRCQRLTDEQITQIRAEARRAFEEESKVFLEASARVFGAAS